MKNILTLFVLALSVMFALSSCESQDDAQKAEQISDTEIELTREQIDSLNEAEQKMLIWRYNAVALNDTNLKFTYSYEFQTLCDSSEFIALDGRVFDIIRHNEQMILKLDLDVLDIEEGKAILSISKKLFVDRGREFDNQIENWGCFIVRIRKTYVKTTTSVGSEVTDTWISEDGEAEASSSTTCNEYRTISLHGELVDFYLNK